MSMHVASQYGAVICATNDIPDLYLFRDICSLLDMKVTDDKRRKIEDDLLGLTRVNFEMLASFGLFSNASNATDMSLSLMTLRNSNAGWKTIVDSLFDPFLKREYDLRETFRSGKKTYGSKECTDTMTTQYNELKKNIKFNWR